MSDLLAKCDVCGALLDEEDMFCANCGTEAPRRDQQQAAVSHTTTHNFECSGCGASMSYSATAGALACPFCASVDLVKKKDVKVLAPDSVVPLALNRDAAVAAMRRWLGRGFWRPADLSQQAMIVSIKPVYVPYWVFQAETHTYWTADTNRTPRGARGDWFPLFGEHHGRYTGLLVGASGALQPSETSAICPFNLADAAPPDDVDLQDATVEQFSMQRKYARPLARAGLENLERAECQQRYVPGKARNMKVNVRINGLSSRPMLLPVWIMAYRYKGEVFRFLVNGQTGKATGRAPFSWRKLAAVVGISLAVIAVIGIIALIAGIAGGR